MSERIRYTKPVNGLSTSVQTFTHPTNGAQYKIVLTEGAWSVVDATNSSLVAASGTNPQKHKAQLEARAALTSLGIELTRETRKERTVKAEAAAA